MIEWVIAVSIKLLNVCNVILLRHINSENMKQYLLCFYVFLLAITNALAQNNRLHGVYKMENKTSYALWLFADGYSSMIHYTDKQYLSTTGGPFTFDGTTIHITTEYNDIDSTAVGETVHYALKMDGENLKNESDSTWVKQPSESTPLDGLWRITGRQQSDGMTMMKQGDRKTIKLLVDGYFQWIAINPAEQGFYGTGGGKYIFENNKYAEQLLFFSRDNTRIGTSLKFDGEIKEGQWHHKGLSSKGNEIHEIWSRETQ